MDDNVRHPTMVLGISFSNENGTLFSRSLQEAIMKNWFELKIEWGIYMHGLAFAGDR
uniref:Uncharacterized protein n=1 Tax=Nelumbo nucifera TaxID=4432 RepID=A0A822YNX9_NELNU|nr:TPA_asm: hypothetical protein HUJ06_009160 [Nelumbo nucifera]DAD33039.1 TPA_asm: hypothetical protein HUJ06_011891 [Nelumbo nucifera]